MHGHGSLQSHSMATPEKRKYRRFALRYSVHLQFRSAGRDSQLDGVTKNVSMGGLLLESASSIPKRCPVTFTITLVGGQVTRPIELLGEGEVVRVEPQVPGPGFAIALEYARPIELHRLTQASLL